MSAVALGRGPPPPRSASSALRWAAAGARGGKWPGTGRDRIGPDRVAGPGLRGRAARTPGSGSSVAAERSRPGLGVRLQRTLLEQSLKLVAVALLSRDPLPGD